MLAERWWTLAFALCFHLEMKDGRGPLFSPLSSLWGLAKWEGYKKRLLNFAEIEESILSTDKIVSQRELRIRKLAVSQVHGVSSRLTTYLFRILNWHFEIYRILRRPGNETTIPGFWKHQSGLTYVIEDRSNFRLLFTKTLMQQEEVSCSVSEYYDVIVRQYMCSWMFRVPSLQPSFWNG